MNRSARKKACEKQIEDSVSFISMFLHPRRGNICSRIRRKMVGRAIGSARAAFELRPELREAA